MSGPRRDSQTADGHGERKGGQIAKLALKDRLISKFCRQRLVGLGHFFKIHGPYGATGPLQLDRADAVLAIVPMAGRKVGGHRGCFGDQQLLRQGEGFSSGTALVLWMLAGALAVGASGAIWVSMEASSPDGLCCSMVLLRAPYNGGKSKRQCR